MIYRTSEIRLSEKESDVALGLSSSLPFLFLLFLLSLSHVPLAFPLSIKGKARSPIRASLSNTLKRFKCTHLTSFTET
jgi:hypothetical protein